MHGLCGRPGGRSRALAAALALALAAASDCFPAGLGRPFGRWRPLRDVELHPTRWQPRALACRGRERRQLSKSKQAYVGRRCISGSGLSLLGSQGGGLLSRLAGQRLVQPCQPIWELLRELARTRKRVRSIPTCFGSCLAAVGAFARTRPKLKQVYMSTCFIRAVWTRRDLASAWMGLQRLASQRAGTPCQRICEFLLALASATKSFASRNHRSYKRVIRPWIGNLQACNSILQGRCASARKARESERPSGRGGERALTLRVGRRKGRSNCGTLRPPFVARPRRLRRARIEGIATADRGWETLHGAGRRVDAIARRPNGSGAPNGRLKAAGGIDIGRPSLSRERRTEKNSRLPLPLSVWTLIPSLPSPRQSGGGLPRKGNAMDTNYDPATLAELDPAVLLAALAAAEQRAADTAAATVASERIGAAVAALLAQAGALAAGAAAAGSGAARHDGRSGGRHGTGRSRCARDSGGRHRSRQSPCRPLPPPAAPAAGWSAIGATFRAVRSGLPAWRVRRGGCG